MYEETKRNDLEIETGKLREREDKKVIYECLREMNMRIEQGKRKMKKEFRWMGYNVEVEVVERVENDIRRSRYNKKDARVPQYLRGKKLERQDE